jgi:hypothetical protein
MAAQRLIKNLPPAATTMGSNYYPKPTPIGRVSAPSFNLSAPVQGGNLFYVCAVVAEPMRKRPNMQPKITGEIMQVDAAFASLQPEI